MSEPGVASAIVTVGERETSVELAAKLADVVVDQQLRVPDRVTLRYRDYDLAVVDGGTFAVGAALRVALGSAAAGGTTTVFDGQVTALEPEFTEQGAALVVCGMDRGCLLQRTPRTTAYQQTSYGEIAAAVAARAGLAPGELADGLRLPFVQQSNETDWDFLWRLALEVDCQVRVDGRTLAFAPAAELGADVTRLEWGERLLAFRPRVSGVQQVGEVTVRGWDPATASALAASASAPAPESRLGLERDAVVAAMGAGTASVVDRPLMGQEHADALARSLAAQLASVFVEGHGVAEGTPALAAGGQLRIDGVGRTFSGTYAVTGVRHRYRARSGYRTEFSICGRAQRSLLGLARAPQPPGWERRIVVGVVTNSSDPDELGRVRVRHPALDADHEGWWARVLAPGSGAARGFFSLPQVGDEVLVAFEHGSEQHPYVLGSVFNTTCPPGAVVQSDGSFTLATPHRVAIDATERAEVATGDALALTAAKDATLSAGAAATVGAKSGLTLSGGTTVEVAADGSVTVSGGTVSISATGTLELRAPAIVLG